MKDKYKVCTMTIQKGTAKKKVQKKTETTYCAGLRDAMRNNLPLRANRRGVILTSDGERPSFTIDKLSRNRRMGLSYKQIGKKLGIDPDRYIEQYVMKLKKSCHHRCSSQGDSTYSSLVFV